MTRSCYLFFQLFLYLDYFSKLALLHDNLTIPSKVILLQSILIPIIYTLVYFGTYYSYISSVASFKTPDLISNWARYTSLTSSIIISVVGILFSIYLYIFINRYNQTAPEMLKKMFLGSRIRRIFQFIVAFTIIDTISLVFVGIVIYTYYGDISDILIYRYLFEGILWININLRVLAFLFGYREILMIGQWLLRRQGRRQLGEVGFKSITILK